MPPKNQYTESFMNIMINKIWNTISFANLNNYITVVIDTRRLLVHAHVF